MGQVKNTFKRIDTILRSEEHDALMCEALKLASAIRELIRDYLEEEEDIREGMKALEETGNTVDWATFKKTL